MVKKPQIKLLASMKSSFFYFFIFFIICISCKEPSSKKVLEAVISKYEQKQNYDFDKTVSVENTIKFYQLEADFAKELIKEIKAIKEEELSETDKISKELLLFSLQDKIDQFKYKMFLNPITNEVAFHLNLANMGTTVFKNSDDIQNYFIKLENLNKSIDYNINLLRAGVKAKVSQPKAVFSNYKYTYDTHIVDDVTKSAFFKPFLKLPKSISENERMAILKKAKKSVQKNVVEKYQQIKDFFEQEYFKNTREAIGVDKTPNGAQFYQNRINFYTTSNQYTADDIHKIGLQEVARIKLEMQKIIDSLHFKGSFADFITFLRTDQQFYPKTAKELLRFARDISKRIDAELPKYFKTLPRKPYGVVPVPAAIAPNYTGGRYSGTKNPLKAGFYWVNTYNLPSRTLYTIPALTAHEAVPGHHLQISLNNELSPEKIPAFRRNLYLSAFGEGWGLYAETLAEEMGIYTTPYELFGKYTYEMWRACRLVVDTGIHAKGWSRQQVIDYMAANTALSLHEVTTETDRYISWPGQAISYKIGEIKIRELRAKAEKILKDKFSIRDFHEVILSEGTVTLAIMESRVNNYIDEKLHE